MEAPRFLKIHLEGGLGDCLKVIMCNYPLQRFYNEYGTQTFVTYGGSNRNDCGWDTVLKNDIFDRSDAFIYLDPEVFYKISAPTAESVFDGQESRTEYLIPLQLKVTAPLLPKDRRHIGLQLDSNDSRKKFAISKWRELAEKIVSKYRYTDLHIIDCPSQKDKIEKHFKGLDRVHNHAGLPLGESISLISEMDLFIAPDSFSKYICLCSKVPAIILCAELSYLTVPEMLRTCFKNIEKNDNYTLLGLGDEPLTDINSISVKEILARV